MQWLLLVLLIIVAPVQAKKSAKKAMDNTGILETQEDKLQDKEDIEAMGGDIDDPDSFEELSEDKSNNIVVEDKDKGIKKIGKDIVDMNIKNLLTQFEPLISIPAFMTAKMIAPVGRVIGPVDEIKKSLINSKIYIKWLDSNNQPRIGDRFAIYHPAVVFQSIEKATEYFIYPNTWRKRKDLDTMTHAGYYYEIVGELEVQAVTRSLVTTKLVSGSDIIDVGTEIIRAPPSYTSITPITGGQPIHAAVVSGYPTTMISPRKGQMIFLNRGAMDGVKIGRVFESWELVPLTEYVEDNPKRTIGKAMVTFVTDNFSTAVITEQFDIIRKGSKMRASTSGSDRPEDYKLAKGYISRNYSRSSTRLDDIEVKMGDLNLTPAERKRLEQLHREQLLQRKSRSRSQAEGAEFAPSPDDPTQAPISTDTPAFFDDDVPQKKENNLELSDEQELNQMMQF